MIEWTIEQWVAHGREWVEAGWEWSPGQVVIATGTTARPVLIRGPVNGWGEIPCTDLDSGREVDINPVWLVPYLADDGTLGHALGQVLASRPGLTGYQADVSQRRWWSGAVVVHGWEVTLTLWDEGADEGEFDEPEEFEERGETRERAWALTLLAARRAATC